MYLRTHFKNSTHTQLLVSALTHYSSEAICQSLLGNALSDALQSSHERTRLHNWNHSTLPEGVSVSFFSSRLLQFFILFASVVSFYTSKPVLCVCVSVF